MLNGLVIEKSVQFDCFVGGSSVFVLSGVFADPEMDVILQVVLARFFVGLEFQLNILNEMKNRRKKAEKEHNYRIYWLVD